MDLRQLKHIMKEFESSTIQKLEITEKDFTVKMEKPNVGNDESNKSYQNNNVAVENINNLDSNEINTMSDEVNKNVLVKSPLVGVFYDSPSPDSDPFIKLNQKVNKGDVICIIEAMKVMNEIVAPVSGTIQKIHIENAMMVEYGQIVMEIKE